MRKKQVFIVLGAILILLLVGVWSWNRWGATTKVALVNFPGFQSTGIILSNQSSHVKYEQLKQDQIDKFDSYDCVLIFGMGIKWSEGQRDSVMQIAQAGTPLKVVYATTPENNISGLDSIQEQRVMEYLETGSKQNYKNLALYLRKYVDGKSWFAPEPKGWVEGASDVYYHLDEQVACKSRQEFETYLRGQGLYHESGAKVLIVGGFNDPFSGAKENLDSLITSLHRSGLNVYPITTMSRRLEFIQEVQPDLIIHMAHGRLLMGEGEKAVEYLKELNAPIISPLTIMQNREKWEQDPMGMVGGFLSQTIVMPELDGSTYPYTLFTQEKTDEGYEVVKAMPDRLKTFTSLVNRLISLKRKPNADKKVAIYFFKGPGQESLAAQGLESIPSLYNVLRRLQAEGYNLAGLPASLEEFRRDIVAQGQVFQPYAEGQMEQFVEQVRPQLIARRELEDWISKDLSKELQQQLVQDYGPAPGVYMTQMAEGESKLIVSCLRYGNVALLPQPMAGVGSDGFAIAHGAKMPPPYPYVGVYLWGRNGFGADIMMHFGTHGSLEFTPSKQVALSNNDWPDQLVADTPHFYYYTIGNIGESVMAKRRSYATTVSYLTPAFNESGARGLYTELHRTVHKYYDASSDAERERIALEIKDYAMKLGLHRDLRLDSIPGKAYTAEEIERIDNFAEEISTEKVNASLYTTGEAYSPERLRSTVLAMSVDPIAYAKAKLDGLRHKTHSDYIKNRRTFGTRYLAPAKKLVEQVLSGKPADEALVLSYAGISADELARARELTKPKTSGGMMGMMRAQSSSSAGKSMGGHPAGMPKGQAMGGHPAGMPKGQAMGGHPAGMPKGQAIGGHPAGMPKGQAMGGHPAGMPKGQAMSGSSTGIPKAKAIEENMKARAAEQSKGDKHQVPAASKQELEQAQFIMEVEQTILNIKRYEEALRTSPALELDAIVDACSGGYIAPSSGGDAVANPNAVPTGHNLYSISAESTPSQRAWEKGVALVQQTLQDYQKRHGRYPTKISYTFWSSEFIETQGASIAQVLYLLGVEPIRNTFGRVSDLRLIPTSELGRPRIDVVIQTSGQFRDLAASRLALITRAIEMAAAAPKEEFENFVAQGAVETERLLVDAGMSPKDARALSTKRIFGGINGMYGTGIQEMITSGDKWEREQEIAEVYLNNMGASYADLEDWGKFTKPLFRAALANTDVVIQPRQSNTWGALSLDHVYEFMGGLTLTVRNVTGKDPDAYFADYRNRNNFRMQDLKEAIGVESRATVLNPTFVQEMLQGGASSLGRVTEIVTNTYGWNVAKPEVIEDALWRELYHVYVEDKFALNLPKVYEDVNPKAMQEITAVMLETIRKGMWQATSEEINKLATVHVELTNKFGASGGGMSSGNAKLRQFITQHAPEQMIKAFEQKHQELKQASNSSTKDGVVMKQESRSLDESASSSRLNGIFVIAGVLILFILLVILLRRKRKG